MVDELRSRLRDCELSRIVVVLNWKNTLALNMLLMFINEIILKVYRISRVNTCALTYGT